MQMHMENAERDPIMEIRVQCRQRRSIKSSWWWSFPRIRRTASQNIWCKSTQQLWIKFVEKWAFSLNNWHWSSGDKLRASRTGENSAGFDKVSADSVYCAECKAQREFTSTHAAFQGKFCRSRTFLSYSDRGSVGSSFDGSTTSSQGAASWMSLLYEIGGRTIQILDKKN